MKILLVEDDVYKSTAIKQWIETEHQNTSVELTVSYRDGCLAALEGGYQLLILDMSLPARTQKVGSAKDTIVNGGELIIRELLDERVPFNAVILTQYETFNGETIEAIDERMKQMCGDSFYGCISYNSQDDSWKNNLQKILNDVKSSNC
jgi:DNA-binding NarL/FixJ family response regulator